jgi:hypothetical protein
MSRISWQLVELASRLLDHGHREPVLGDLAETGESVWQALRAVLSLFFRWQAALWLDWRPWLAGFGTALPGSFLLMGVSASVTCTFERLTFRRVFDPWWPTGHEGFLLLLCHMFLLIAWAWTSGFVVGSVSKRTLWMSAALCVAPCVFCSGWFHMKSLPRACMLLFLLPAIGGVRQGLKGIRIPLSPAFLLAIIITALMIFAWSNQALWNPNWALIWPVWYLVASAWKSGEYERNGPQPIGHAA